MKRLNALLLGVVFVIMSQFVSAAPEKPLNLLIITADDMNGDSWFNCPVGATPNLDALARRSYRFEHCHVTAPICQPSRSALMTGRVPHRNGALGFHPINLDVPTLVEVLGSNGYFTAAINKGGHMQPQAKFNWDLRLDGSGKNPKSFRDDFEQCLQASAQAKKPFFINANSTDPHRPFAGSRKGASGESEESGNGVTAKKNNRKNEAYAAPVKMYAESEVTVPAFLEDLPDVRKEMAQYFSSVRRMDQSIGELMAALKASGMEDRTVIVFLSDHGISAPFAKATLYFNGTWSPLLIRWPGLEKPINNTEDMITTIDVMPTVLELMGVSAPAGMDGRSLVPLLNGKKQPNRDYVITHVNSVSSGKSFPSRCVRTKTHAYLWNAWPDGKTPYKVEGMAGLTFAALQQGGQSNPDLKKRVDHFLYRTAEEFYDRVKDPAERDNRVSDPAYQKEIARLKKLLLARMEQTGDPLLEAFRKVANQ